MSKSVLVIDTPKNCTECPLSCETEVYNANLCRAIPEHGVNMNSSQKPDWCPLRELPRKKKLSYDNLEYDLQAKMWNDCIDAIGGDAK